MRFLLQLATLMTIGTFTAVEAAVIRKRGPATVHEKCTVPGTFALTFDDGPYNYSWDLSAKLKANGIRATFFINGKNYVDVETESDKQGHSYVDILKHMDASGHQVASHTYQHQNLRSQTPQVIRYQMIENEKIISGAIGKKPAFMRPPEGAYDSNALSVLGDLGYQVIMWDIDALDWQSHNLASEQKNYKDVINAQGIAGHISLQHEVYADTANQLVDWIIKTYKGKVNFVTVAECLGMAPYV